MRRKIYDYFFLLLLISVIYGLVKLLLPFAGAIVGALICAVTFYPMYLALVRWFPRMNPSAHAILADALVMIFFVTPLILLMWAIIQESSTLLPMLQQGSTTVSQLREGQVLESMPFIGRVSHFMGSTFGIQRAQFQANMIEVVNRVLQYVSVNGTQLAKNTLVGLFQLLIMLFTLFFLFRDGIKLVQYVFDLVPMRQEDKERLTLRTHDMAIGLVRGLLLTSLLQGVVAAIGYFLIGLPGAVLLGAVTAIVSLIPFIGTFGVWVPIGVLFILNGAYIKGIFVLFWGAVVVVGIIDTLVRPYLVGKSAEIPLYALFFALLGGVEVWGAKGIVLGPLLAGAFPVLLEIYRHRYLRHDGVNDIEEASL